MFDRREQILARLVTIFGTVPGIKRVARNREEVQGRDRPAIIMHDASESQASDPQIPSGRPAKATKDFITLSPQIFILHGAGSDIVGTEISVFRQLLIPLVWQDDLLWSFVGQNGHIRYAGCGLDTTTGEGREGRLEVKFEFTYMLDSKELME